MISAHYDDFSAAPGKPGGGNGSGVVAVLSLMRLFGSLYRNAASRPPVNILFLLTGGGGMDMMGLKYWIKSAETRVLDSIEFVISLDTISSVITDDELYFHYSKPPKDPIVADWYRRFSEAAQHEGKTMHMVHKKINLALPHMTWEHEHWAHQKLLGATLSGLGEADNPMFRASLLDRPSVVDRKVLASAIRIVGHAISTRLYEEEGRAFPAFANLSDALPGLEPRFLEKWIASMGSVPKMAPFATAEDPFGAALFRFLKLHTDREMTTSFKMHPEFTLYDGIVFQMGVFKAAGVLVDLMLLVGVMVYLTLLFTGLKVATQGWNALFALLKSPQQRGKKPSSGGKGFVQKIVAPGKKS